MREKRSFRVYANIIALSFTQKTNRKETEKNYKREKEENRKIFNKLQFRLSSLLVTE